MLQSYKVQIAVSFFVILAILIAITITKDLYNQTLNNDANNRQLNQSIEKRGRLVVIMYLFAAVYFTYLAWSTYKKNQTTSNLMFLIATELVLIATFIRYLGLVRNQTADEVDELI